jgi:predicted alpha/beta-hydrolase family hydrolase
MQEPMFTTIPISGYLARPVANVLIQQPQVTSTLAVIFPGVNYSCDMPLLYYTARLLGQRNSDVLNLHTEYNQPEYRSLPPAQRAEWISTDATACVEAGLAHREYQKLILIGKSIGTLSLATLVSQEIGAGAITVWLTPLLRHPFMVEAALRFQGPALFISGTGDDLFEADSLNRIQQATRAESIIIDGANHSLEIPGKMEDSLQVLKQVMVGIGSFLDRNGN